MERLTDKNDDGNYFYPKCFEKCDGLGESRKCDKCEIPCNCKHNSNSRVKVNSLEIIVRMIGNKPYYELKYRQVGKKDYSIGYSSYDLKIVLGYIDTYFEIVESDNHTNADRIRNMSDEELAEFIEQISTDSMETISFGTKEYKEIWERKETALEWLQSEEE